MSLDVFPPRLQCPTMHTHSVNSRSKYLDNTYLEIESRTPDLGAVSPKRDSWVKNRGRLRLSSTVFHTLLDTVKIFSEFFSHVFYLINYKTSFSVLEYGQKSLISLLIFLHFWKRSNKVAASASVRTLGGGNPAEQRSRFYTQWNSMGETWNFPRSLYGIPWSLRGVFICFCPRDIKSPWSVSQGISQSLHTKFHMSFPMKCHWGMKPVPLFCRIAPPPQG